MQKGIVFASSKVKQKTTRDSYHFYTFLNKKCAQVMALFFGSAGQNLGKFVPSPSPFIRSTVLLKLSLTRDERFVTR